MNIGKEIWNTGGDELASIEHDEGQFKMLEKVTYPWLRDYICTYIKSKLCTHREYHSRRSRSNKSK